MVKVLDGEQFGFGKGVKIIQAPARKRKTGRKLPVHPVTWVIYPVTNSSNVRVSR